MGQGAGADPMLGGAGLRGPFNALLRSPDLCDLVQRVGAHVRYSSAIPARLNEMAIIMAGRKWTAQYEFYAHRRLGIEAGLNPAILDSVANGRRPEAMSADETIVYEFVMSLLGTGHVPDPRYQADHPAHGPATRFGSRQMSFYGAIRISVRSMVWAPWVPCRRALRRASQRACR